MMIEREDPKFGPAFEDEASSPSADGDTPMDPVATEPDTLVQQAAPAPADALPESGGVDLLQLMFWTSLLVAVAAAVVAIAYPEAVGGTGPMLLIALASGGLMFLFWIMTGLGRKIGLFPERGAAADAVTEKRKPYAWIETLDEAVLVTEQGSGPMAANEAYRNLAKSLDADAENRDRPPPVDRVFGTVSGLSAPIYRLSRAASAGQTLTETLPAITLGDDGAPAQFEARVSPLSPTRTLWRLRRLNSISEVTGAADARALYVEDAPHGFFVARANGTVTYMNKWLRTFLGLPDDVQGMRLDDIIRPESLRTFRRDRRTERPSQLSLFFKGRDGIEKAMPTVTNWSGRGADALSRTLVISPLSAPADIEQRHRAEVSHPRPGVVPETEPMFSDAPFGVVQLHGESIGSAKVVEANLAMLELVEGRATPGTCFVDLFLDGDTQQTRETIAEQLIEAVDHFVELELPGNSAKTVNVFVTMNAEGTPQTAYLIDVTELKQLKVRLTQGEKMQAIGMLAGGVAHDFNNMLTGVMLNCGQLMEQHPLGDPSFPHIAHIENLSLRASELVKMLLAFSRQQTFKRTNLNMTDVLSDCGIMLRQLLDERVSVKTIHGRDLPMVKADRAQLENALINLATNAKDAMLKDGGGTLTIRTSRVTGDEAADAGFDFVEEGDYLCIEVIDTGHGMSPETMEKIFQPFFTTKDQGKGTGFGLATVYGIVKQSGGYIGVDSKVGEGTTFRIYLPALDPADVEADEEAAAPDTSKATPPPQSLNGRGCVLLVEDEDSVRNNAVRILKARGYKMLDAEDGESALEIIKAHQGEIDLLISDVILPGMDGPTLLKEAKAYLGNAKVMFISGYSENDLSKTLDEERAISFMPKPFGLPQLAERVREELYGSESRHAA